MLVLYLSGCTVSGDSDKTTSPETTSSSILLEIQGNPITIIPENGNGHVYDPIMMTSEFAMDFVLRSFAGYDVYFNGQHAVSNGDGLLASVSVDKLDKDTMIEVRLVHQKTGQEIIQYIRTLANGTPDYLTLCSGDGGGVYYFMHLNYLIKMDSLGKIIFYKYVPYASTDFKKHEINGKTYYSYGRESLSLNVPHFSAETAYVVMDETYHVIDEVAYAIPGESVKESTPIDVHDFIMLDEGHYIYGVYNPVRVTNISNRVPHAVTGARVITNVIQEVKDGELVFEWDSANYPGLYGASSDGNDYYNTKALFSDYAHWNSLEIDPADNNLIMSFRHLDAVLKVDRQTGDIIWILGGALDQFGLTGNQMFSKQHDARIHSDGIITLFDNGNNNTHSRVLEFKLDEKSKTVLAFNAYGLEGQYSSFAGNAQRQGDEGHRYVIGWGGRDTTNAMLTDVDFSTNTINFEVMHPTTTLMDYLYRAYRFDS